MRTKSDEILLELVGAMREYLDPDGDVCCDEFIGDVINLLDNEESAPHIKALEKA